MVFKAHEPASNYYKIAATILGSSDDADKIMGAYVDWMNFTEEYQPGMWAGYPSWGPYENYTVLSLFLCYFGPEQEAMQALQVFDDAVNRHNETLSWI